MTLIVLTEGIQEGPLGMENGTSRLGIARECKVCEWEEEEGLRDNVVLSAWGPIV